VTTLLRATRALGVSFITTAINIAGMWALLSFSSLPGASANVIVLLVEAPLAYRLLKRWVWKNASSLKVRREQMLFYVMYSLNICVAAVVLHLSEHLVAGSPHRVVLTMSIQWSVFATLWLGEFLICDRFLFKEKPPTANGPGASL
jgi:putative flippase GtrA